MDEITIGCQRTDCPPWNDTPPDPIWWAYMMEDSCDGHGDTAAEAIGNLMMLIARLYEGEAMPYIKSIQWQKD